MTSRARPASSRRPRGFPSDTPFSWSSLPATGRMPLGSFARPHPRVVGGLPRLVRPVPDHAEVAGGVMAVAEPVVRAGVKGMVRAVVSPVVKAVVKAVAVARPPGPDRRPSTRRAPRVVPPPSRPALAQEAGEAPAEPHFGTLSIPPRLIGRRNRPEWRTLAANGRRSPRSQSAPAGPRGPRSGRRRWAPWHRRRRPAAPCRSRCRIRRGDRARGRAPTGATR